MTKPVRQKIIAAVTFLGGLYFFLEFVLPEKIGTFEFGKFSDQIIEGIQVVGIMSIGLGIINVFAVHGSRIIRSQKGWYNSLILIVGMLVMFVVESFDVVAAERRLAASREFYNLAQFIERIDADYLSQKIEPKPRLDALGLRLDQISAGLESGNSGYSAPEGSPLKVRNAVQELRAGVEQAKGNLAGLEQSIKGDRPIQPASPPAADKANAEEEPAAQAPATALPPAVAAERDKLKQLALLSQDLTKANYEGAIAFKFRRLIREGLFSQLGAAMFSLLAFYIATAAFRSFRVRSKEAALMMIAALIVMLGQIPHGPIYISEDLPQIRLWLLKNVNTPVNRAIFFGAAIAGLAAAVRLWLSLERSPLSDDSASSKPAAEGGA